MGHDNERAALIYQHKSSPADRQIADGLDALLRASRDQRTDDDGTTGALARCANDAPMFVNSVLVPG
jgi:hypothetical protein